MRIVPMTRRLAEQVATWRYPPPYEAYDMTGADPAFLSDPASGFHAVVDGDELVGFRSFGADGRVCGWAYDDSALDTGGGLRPDRTGQGLGRRAIATGLVFGIDEFAPEALRMTIASFNMRALRVVQSLGFVRVAAFDAAAGGRRFDVLTAAVDDLRDRLVPVA